LGLDYARRKSNSLLTRKQLALKNVVQRGREGEAVTKVREADRPLNVKEDPS